MSDDPDKFKSPKPETAGEKRSPPKPKKDKARKSRGKPPKQRDRGIFHRKNMCCLVCLVVAFLCCCLIGIMVGVVTWVLHKVDQENERINNESHLNYEDVKSG